MPSEKDLIKDSVQKALTTDEAIDLLLISKSLDDINGEVVGTDQDYGMHYNYLFIGMSGRQLVDQMNSNFHATDAQFLAHHNAIELRIKSNTIKEIKEVDGILYYTSDGETWTSLQATWGKVTGDITKQTDLQNALATKTPIDDFNKLVIRVSNNEDAILTLQNTLTQLVNTVNGLSNQINGQNGILVRLSGVEATLASKITSQDVKEIRAKNGTALEFTIDGTTWLPVSDAGLVEWGNIIGDIANQADLQSVFSNIRSQISSVSSELSETNTELTEHTQNINNPHQVSAAQIGLENVNNTSDMDKPVSTAQRQAIDEAIASVSGSEHFISLTKAQYDALTTKDANTFYFINDL